MSAATSREVRELPRMRRTQVRAGAAAVLKSRIKNQKSKMLPSAAQIGQAPGRFLNAAGIGFVRGHFAVELDGPSALIELLVIDAGGAEACLVLRLRVPLVTAFVVLRGPAVMLVRLALVNVAEHVGRVGN